MNKLINRIGKILDENEFLNETLFYELFEELNNNYLLIKSYKYEDYINYINSFYQN